MSIWAGVVADWAAKKDVRGEPPPVVVTEKPCTKCGTVKVLAAFYERSERPGTYSAACKDCVNTANKASAKRLRERRKLALAKFEEPA